MSAVQETAAQADGQHTAGSNRVPGAAACKRFVFCGLESGICGGTQPTLSAALATGRVIVPVTSGNSASFTCYASSDIAYAQSVPSCFILERFDSYRLTRIPNLFIRWV